MNRHLCITILELTTRLAFKMLISSINCLFFILYLKKKLIVFGIFDTNIHFFLASTRTDFNYYKNDDKTAPNINKWQTFESRACFLLLLLLFVAIPFCYCCIDIVFIVWINRIKSSIDLEVVTSLNYACDCIWNFQTVQL